MITVKVYSSQPSSIVQRIQEGNTHYAKMDAIREKYGKEIASIFTSAYNWFICHAEQLVHRPPEAESALWSYMDLYNIEKHIGYQLLELEVPLDQVIFFKMADWNKVLNQRFLGTSEEETNAFDNKLNKQGIAYEGDIFRKPFYPQLKQEVVKSWLNLFRFHEQIRNSISNGQLLSEKDIQVAHWQLPTTWIKGVLN